MSPDISAQDKVYDFLIQNALIFDGESERGFYGDAAIVHDTILGVGKFDVADAREVIDAGGLVLAPGFIDTHTHSDFNPLIYPNLSHKLMQGVTTEIVGNCGMSAAPIQGVHEEHIHAVWAREGVELPESISWKTYREYHDTLEQTGLVTNMAGLVGHGNLRAAVMGLAVRTASAAEILAMKQLLAQAMEDGAYGISFGLVYLPGIFANQEELVELCREAARHGGICAFHMRNEGSKLIEAIREVISIAEKTKARIQISHLKAAGKNNWGKIREAFQLIEQARQTGLSIEADAYPYTASFAELGVILPDAYYEREDRVAFFKDPSHREEILKELWDYYTAKNMDWNSIVIATTPLARYQSFEGRTIKEITGETGQTPEELLVELLADTSFQVSAFSFSQNEQVVDQVLSKSYVTVGSDSIADGSRRPHPRAYGTFSKIFKEFVREKKQWEIGSAIRKMTSLPAEHFGLKQRGRIQPGYMADLILFDPAQVRDRATYKAPKMLSEGMAWVFVNGTPVIRNGNFVPRKEGRFLLRNG